MQMIRRTGEQKPYGLDDLELVGTHKNCTPHSQSPNRPNMYIAVTGCRGKRFVIGQKSICEQIRRYVCGWQRGEEWVVGGGVLVATLR